MRIAFKTLGCKLNFSETATLERRLAQAREADISDAVYAPLLAELERLRRKAPGIRFTLEENDTDSLFCIRIPKKSGKRE